MRGCRDFRGGYPLRTAELSKDGVPLMQFMLGSTLVCWDFAQIA